MANLYVVHLSVSLWRCKYACVSKTQREAVLFANFPSISVYHQSIATHGNVGGVPKVGTNLAYDASTSCIMLCVMLFTDIDIVLFNCPTQSVVHLILLVDAVLQRFATILSLRSTTSFLVCSLPQSHARHQRQLSKRVHCQGCTGNDCSACAHAGDRACSAP